MKARYKTKVLGIITNSNRLDKQNNDLSVNHTKGKYLM